MRGIDGDRDKTAAKVNTIRAIPVKRGSRFFTVHEASQWNA
jgi:hypothetical protein